MFKYTDQDGAEALTGSPMFDVMKRDWFDNEQKSAIDTAFGSFTTDKQAAPVVLQVFGPKEI